MVSGAHGRLLGIQLGKRCSYLSMAWDRGVDRVTRVAFSNREPNRFISSLQNYVLIELRIRIAKTDMLD